MHIGDYTLPPLGLFQCAARLEAGRGRNFTFGVRFATVVDGDAALTESSIPLPPYVALQDLEVLHVIDAAGQRIEAKNEGRVRRPVALLHLPTDLILPVALGGWTLSGPWDEFDSPDLGMAVSFAHPSGRSATLYIYDGGLETIPDGAVHEPIRTHMVMNEDEIGDMSAGFLVLPEQRTVGYGPDNHRHDWLLSSFVIENHWTACAERSWIFLTGWKDHFVKVRATESEDGRTAGEVEGDLAALVGHLSLGIAHAS